VAHFPRRVRGCSDVQAVRRDPEGCCRSAAGGMGREVPGIRSGDWASRQAWLRQRAKAISFTWGMSTAVEPSEVPPIVHRSGAIEVAEPQLDQKVLGEWKTVVRVGFEFPWRCTALSVHRCH
jgi:hypothetical protein